MNRKQNIDFISAVRKSNSLLSYKEFDIKEQHQDLIAKIENILDDDTIFLPDIQKDFTMLITKEYGVSSYCLPHNYNDSFISKADYPKIYTRDQFKELIEKKEVEYIESEVNIINKEKEDNRIDELTYQQKLIEIKAKAKEVVQIYVAKLKSDFVKESIRYIHATVYRNSLKAVKKDLQNIMYSTEDIGWTSFKYEANSNLKIELKTNFCYGKSTYFHITLDYKGLTILFYPKLVQYYYVNMFDILDCTMSFIPNRNNWKEVLTFVVDESNLATVDEYAFVNKWIIEGTNELVKGLREILNNPNEVLGRMIQCVRDDSSLYRVRNMSSGEIADYKVYRNEMTIAFQAEKISDSLLLLPNLQELSKLYKEIIPIIGEIEKINREFFPILHKAIIILTQRVELTSRKLEEITKDYNHFKRVHYKEFNDYKRSIVLNKNDENYFETHPDIKELMEKKIHFDNGILSITEEEKRLKKFLHQLSICAQMIWDYDLSSPIYENEFLSCDISRKQIKLGVEKNTLLVSKNGKRLIKNVEESQCAEIAVPKSVKVICDSAFTENRYIHSVTLSWGLLKIGNYAFQYCNNLEKIIIPDTVIDMGTSPFFCGCKKIKRIKLPSKIREIPSFSFKYCASLESISLPKLVSKIGDKVFCDCISLKTIRLPNSIEEVGEDIFAGCDNLKFIFIDKGQIAKFEKLLPQYKNKLVESTNVHL